MPPRPEKSVTALHDLTPDPQNANQGTERGRAMLEHSLRQYGAGRSILVDKHGVTIAGEKTLEAWGEMSDAVEIVHSDGQKLIVVQRDDLDVSDPQGPARQLAYLDNRTSEVSLSWDVEAIARDLQAGCEVAALWNPKELQELFASLPDFQPTQAEKPQTDPPSVMCPACGHTFRPKTSGGSP